MYTDACSLIELSAELDDEQQLVEYGSNTSNMILHLAAFIILRVGKSHVRGAVDAQRGQKCYFSVIHLCKKQSVRSDDIASRATIILPQLWTCKSVIRQPDGTPDSLWLRCRSRLGSSLPYDCFWLWRQEFGGQPNPYDGVEGVFLSLALLDRSQGSLTNFQDEVSNSPGKSFLTMGVSPRMGSLNLMGIGWSPETLFQDFQWPLSDELAHDNWQIMEGDIHPPLT